MVHSPGRIRGASRSVGSVERACGTKVLSKRSASARSETGCPTSPKKRMGRRASRRLGGGISRSHGTTRSSFVFPTPGKTSMSRDAEPRRVPFTSLVSPQGSGSAEWLWGPRLTAGLTHDRPSQNERYQQAEASRTQQRCWPTEFSLEVALDEPRNVLCDERTKC